MIRTRATLLALGLFILAVSCGGANTNNNGDTGCPNGQCESDGTGDVGLEDAGFDNRDDLADTAQEDLADTGNTDVSCDECADGQVKCDGEGKYRICEQRNGCWRWSSKAICPVETPTCACAGANEEVCDPDGEACVCVPDCQDKECGIDGCGHYCGTGPNLGCELGVNCIDGTCGGECVSECTEGSTICNGIKVVDCVDINAGVQGAEPCWRYSSVNDCPTNQICQFDECTCVNAQCGDTCCESVTSVCFQNTCCDPQCGEGENTKECGSDMCGGSCGTCPVDRPVCDSDGFCITEGECLSACEPGEQLCQGKLGYLKCQLVAGTTGCYQWSAIAFACPNSTSCDSADNTCKCMPSCTGKECGSDGCGGSCGSCDQPLVCNTSGICACNCDGFPENKVCDLDANKTYKNSCEATCAGAINITKGECPTCIDFCTEDELVPQVICGTDFNTYQNFCELRCAIGSAACVDFLNCPQIQYPGACQPDICEGCPVKYNPVCGSDNETYYNKCDLLMCAPQGTGVKCAGECMTDPSCSTCGSSCEPVCGIVTSASGNPIHKTFPNTCAMTCAGGTLLESGPCCYECGEFDEYVCSDDFLAFKNECYMTCKADPEDYPAKLYTIPLNLDGTPFIDVCEVCKCDLSPDNYEPVCGENFESYYNACALDCVDAVLRCEGECSFENCPCPPQTGGLAIATEETSPANPNDLLNRGVCGADGRTYGNECSAKFFGTTVDKQTWCESCALECAGAGYNPVCCEDGVTYPNLCIPQKCNDLLLPANCKKGKCCEADADCNDNDAETVDQCNTEGVCENL